MKTMIKRECLDTLLSMTLHLKSNRLEFTFSDRAPIINDYSKNKQKAMIIQAWNIIYKYADVIGKELEIFKLQD